MLADVAVTRPGLMLSGLVQAAVAGNAEEIRFLIGASEIRAKIHYPSTSWPNARVQSHIARSIAVAQLLRASEISWECGGEKRCFTEIKETEPVVPNRGLCIFRFASRPASFWEGLRELLGIRHRAHKELYERCLFCPVPVFVDGVRVNNPAPIRRGAGCEVITLAPPGAPPGLVILTPTQARLGFGLISIAGRTFKSEPDLYGQTLILEETGEPQFETHTLPEALGVTVAKLFQPYVDDGGYVHEITRERTDWLNAAPFLARWDKHFECFRARRWLRLTDEKRPSAWRPIVDGVQLDDVVIPNSPAGCLVIENVSELDPQWSESRAQELIRELARFYESWQFFRQSA